MFNPCELSLTTDVRYMFGIDEDHSPQLFIVFREPEMDEMYTALEQLHEAGIVSARISNFSQYSNAINIPLTLSPYLCTMHSH